MTAVQLAGKEDLRIENVAKPEVGEEEILLKVSAGFICGTDLRMYKNGNSKAPAGTIITLGHEVAGVIAAVGSRVSGYREGMRVAVDPNMGCGVCDTCVGGNTQLCAHSHALGIHVHGAFAEYMKIPREAVLQGNIAELPGHVSFEEAALAEPLSCVLNAAERCGTGPGDVVLVIGSGPIGIMHGRIQRLFGAGRVIIHDINEKRLEVCRKLEPDFVTAGPDDIDAVVAEYTDGRGVDVCITAAPSPEAQQKGLGLLGMNGTLMLFGGLPKERGVVPFDANLIHYKQLIVTGTSMQNLRQYRACIDYIAKGIITVKDIITHRYELDQAQEAFENMASGVGLKLGFTINAS